MTSSKPLASAREILDMFYAAERVYMSAPPDQRDFSGLAATLSPDHKLIQTPGLPYGGIYEGHSGFFRLAEETTKRFDVVDVTEREIIENEVGGKVVVLSNVRFKLG
jgi:uncharacterized protein